jgi:hypothetical protein
MKRVVLFGIVLAGLLSGWVGSAAANGGSGSAMACSATPKNAKGGAILVSVANGDVTPSERPFATCAHARELVTAVTSKRVEVPGNVAGFRCTPFVLKTDPDVVKYSCLLRGAEIGTGIKDVFQVVYAKN